MKFVAINPKAKTVETIDAPEVPDALLMIGLTPGEVDHGMLAPRLGYVVHQYSLFVPPAEQSYFSVAGRLIAGPCLMYGVGEAGETVPLMKSMLPFVRFYLGVNDVEAAIERKEVLRPQMSVNNDVIWAWPQPRYRR